MRIARVPPCGLVDARDAHHQGRAAQREPGAQQARARVHRATKADQRARGRTRNPRLRHAAHSGSVHVKRGGKLLRMPGDLQHQVITRRLNLERTGKDLEAVDRLKAGKLQHRCVPNGVGQHGILAVDVPAAILGPGVRQAPEAGIARVFEAAVARPTGDHGVLEQHLTRDVGVRAVLPVKDSAGEGQEVAGPAGGVAQQLGVEENGRGFLFVQRDGVALVGDVVAGGLVGARVFGLADCEGGGDDRPVVHVQPGLLGLSFRFVGPARPLCALVDPGAQDGDLFRAHSAACRRHDEVFFKPRD